MERPLELFYASTQESIINGNDGFGIRYRDKEIPQTIIDRLHDRQVFQYSEGKKTLAGVVEIENNPGIITEFTPVYALFYESYEGKNFVILARTIYLGRDYGWYLEDRQDTARAGNTFTHVMIFNPDRWNNVMLPVFFSLFRPFQKTNVSTNPELKVLLTGKPSQIPGAGILLRENHQDPQNIRFERKLNTRLLYYFLRSLETKSSVILYGPHDETKNTILSLYSTLPKSLLPFADFWIGYQGYGFTGEYRLVAVDQDFIGQPPAADQGYYLLDLYTGNSTSLEEGTLASLVKVFENNAGRAEAFLSFVDKTLTSYNERVKWSDLCHAWCVFGDGSKFWNPPSLPSMSSLVKNISHYPLHENFKQEIAEFIKDHVFDSIKSLDYQSFKTGYYTLTRDFKLHEQPGFPHERFIEMIHAHVHNFAKEKEDLVKNTFKWFTPAPGLHGYYKSWLKDLTIHPGKFATELIQFVARHRILHEDEHKLVLNGVNSELPKPTLEQVFRIQFGKGIDIRKHKFFLEIDKIHLYNSYFEAVTKEFFHKELSQKGLQDTLSAISKAAGSRKAFLQHFGVDLMMDHATHLGNDPKLTIKWLALLKAYELDEVIAEDLLKKVLDKLLWHIHVLDRRQINLIQSYKDHKASRVKNITIKIRKISEWRDNQESGIAPFLLILDGELLENFKLTITNCSPSLWKRTDPKKLAVTLREIFPPAYFDDQARVFFVESGFWETFWRTNPEGWNHGTFILIEALYILSYTNSHKKVNVLGVLKKCLKSWSHLDKAIYTRTIEKTKDQGLEDWLKNNMTLFRKIKGRIQSFWSKKK